MILSTVPGMLVLGCSATLAVSKFRSAILADLAIRGFAISFSMLTRVAFAALTPLCAPRTLWYQDGSYAVLFLTLATQVKAGTA
jgi:hypothetical protein